MNTKTISSVTYILVGNMLTAYSNIGEGLSTKVIVFFGLLLFFVGLIRLKSGLDEKGASGVSKLIWAAILGIIANIFSLIPIVGGIPAGIINLVAFILQVVGIVNLKHSEKLGKTGAVGANILLVAITLMIFAGIFKIVPFVGGTIKMVISFIAFVIIPFGWIKIQEAIAENVLSTSSTVSNSEIGSPVGSSAIQESGNADAGVSFRKSIIVAVGIIGLVIIGGGAYYLFLMPNPERDGKKAAFLMCDWFNKQNKALIDVNSKVNSNLDSHTYSSRHEAKDDYLLLNKSINDKYVQAFEKMDNRKTALQKRYSNDAEKVSKYDESYGTNERQCISNLVGEVGPLKVTVLAKVDTYVGKEDTIRNWQNGIKQELNLDYAEQHLPSLERIKQDLNGREFFYSVRKNENRHFPIYDGTLKNAVLAPSENRIFRESSTYTGDIVFPNSEAGQEWGVKVTFNYKWDKIYGMWNFQNFSYKSYSPLSSR